jgi:hypothetical protein
MEQTKRTEGFWEGQRGIKNRLSLFGTPSLMAIIIGIGAIIGSSEQQPDDLEVSNFLKNSFSNTIQQGIEANG